MKLIALPASTDNTVWMIDGGDLSAVVPGELRSESDVLAARRLEWRRF